jgi:hypothetical protein
MDINDDCIIIKLKIGVLSVPEKENESKENKIVFQKRSKAFYIN